MASPTAMDGSTFCFRSSDADRMTGIEPSLFTAGMREALTSTRATSSMTMQVAIASAPSPPYCSGMCVAWQPAAVSAFRASTGYRDSASTSAACGAISRSAMSRTAARIASCSSVSAYSPAVAPMALLPTGRSLILALRPRTERLLERRVAGEHPLREVGPEPADLGAQPLVGGGEDADGEQPGVAAAADAHRG